MRLLISLLSCIACAAHAQLAGTITSPSGEKMGGVSVSAKAEGGTIRTSVYTDKAGRYRFTDLAPGRYRVWAQAIGYQTARGELEMAPGARQDFELVANADPEQTYRQLPGNLPLDALPETTDHAKRMNQPVRHDCTSCHT